MDIPFQPSGKEFEENTAKQHQPIELNNNIEGEQQQPIVETDTNTTTTNTVTVTTTATTTPPLEVTGTDIVDTETAATNTTTTPITPIAVETVAEEQSPPSQIEVITTDNSENSTTNPIQPIITPSSPTIDSSAIESAIDSPYISSASVFSTPLQTNPLGVTSPPKLSITVDSPRATTEEVTSTSTTPPTTPLKSSSSPPPAPSSSSTNTTNNNHPDRLECKMHRSNYIMTQIGGKKLTDMTLEQLLDEANPTTGMGYKLPGPQGFLEYVGDTVPTSTTTTTTTTTPASTSLSANNKSTSSNNLNKNSGSSSIKIDGKRTASANTSSPILAGLNTPNGNSSPKLKSSSSSIRNSGAISSTSDIGGGSTATKNNNNTGTTGNKDRKSVQKTSTLGRLQKNEEERRKRKEQKRSRAREKPILVAGIEDLPTECIKMVKKSKIPEDKLIQHLNILLPILRFRTGYNLRHVPITSSNQSTNSINSSSSSLNKIKSPETNNNNNNSIENNTPVQNNNSSVINNKTSTSNITIPITTTASQSSQAPYNPSHNGNEDDDYDDGSRLENAILPKGTVDLIETERDVKKLYKNLKQIGSGGFGSVFLAKSTIDKCEIAIKKIAHVSAKAQRTNLNEIGFLNFCKHPNIVGYLRSHLVEDTIWIAMEYMQGGTLTEASQGHTFNESCIAYVAKGMLEGLVYLHSHNIVHRDIKSGNIMMTIDGKIKIVDFGLCVDANERKLVHMAGSPFWMSPEMIRGESYSCPTDIWSFAICLLELANGEPPHRKSSLTAMFTTATEGCSGLDKPERWGEQFTNFLNLCLQMDPTKRSTAEQLLKHPWINLSENPETMKKILAQIFIANVMNHLDN